MGLKDSCKFYPFYSLFILVEFFPVGYLSFCNTAVIIYKKTSKGFHKIKG